MALAKVELVRLVNMHIFHFSKSKSDAAVRKNRRVFVWYTFWYEK